MCYNPYALKALLEGGEVVKVLGSDINNFAKSKEKDLKVFTQKSLFQQFCFSNFMTLLSRQSIYPSTLYIIHQTKILLVLYI